MHCPQCGVQQFGVHQNHEYRCQQCGFTYFHNVAAAVAAIIRCGDEILLTTRAQDPGKGRLDLPGGFVDPGESAEQALIRELQEELQLTIEVSQLRYFASQPNVYRYKEVSYFTQDLGFEVCLEQKPQLNLQLEELQGVQWHEIATLDLHQLGFGSIRKLLEQYQQQCAG